MSAIQKGYKILENVLVAGWHSSGKVIVSDGRHNIYVNRAIPGERVNVAVAKHQKRNYIAGDLINVVQSSPYRIIPLCTHFDECGGCNWMHIQYAQQLEYKKKLIEQAFSKYHLAHPPLSDIVPSPMMLEYRGKVDFALNMIPNGEWYMGYHPHENAHTVFFLKECHIINRSVIETARVLLHAINFSQKSLFSAEELYHSLKGFTLRCNKMGDTMLIINATSEFSHISELVNYLVQHNKTLKSIFLKLVSPEKSTLIHIWGATHLVESLNKWRFRLGPEAFFQPNIYLADQLFNEILTLASPKPDDIIYDLYTGVGTIAIHLALLAKKVIGIENSEAAIQDAKYNAELNNISNVEFVVGDVLKTFVPDFINKHGKPDIVILDPPRSGTLIETLKNIVAFQPRHIVYVSCNPVSLAWNLTYLKDSYILDKIVPFDMFPQTHHVETLVLLKRKN